MLLSGRLRSVAGEEETATVHIITLCSQLVEHAQPAEDQDPIASRFCAHVQSTTRSANLPLRYATDRAPEVSVLTYCRVGFELTRNRCNLRTTRTFSVSLSAEIREVESFQTLSAWCMCRTEHVPAERYSTCSDTLHVENVSPISSSSRDMWADLACWN